MATVPQHNESQESIRHLANYLITTFALSGWAFELSNTKTKAGDCNYTKKLIRVSRYFITKAPRAFVAEVILHEIAHALSGTMGHGAEWRGIVSRIGGNPRRVY